MRLNQPFNQKGTIWLTTAIYKPITAYFQDCPISWRRSGKQSFCDWLMIHCCLLGFGNNLISDLGQVHLTDDPLNSWNLRPPLLSCNKKILSALFWPILKNTNAQTLQQKSTLQTFSGGKYLLAVFLMCFLCFCISSCYVSKIKSSCVCIYIVDSMPFGILTKPRFHRFDKSIINVIIINIFIFIATQWS